MRTIFFVSIALAAWTLSSAAPAQPSRRPPGKPQHQTQNCKRTGADKDKDGVDDGCDHCPGTPKGLAVSLDGCPKSVVPGTCQGDTHAPDGPLDYMITARPVSVNIGGKTEKMLKIKGTATYNDSCPSGRVWAFATMDWGGSKKKQYCNPNGVCIDAPSAAPSKQPTAAYCPGSSFTDTASGQRMGVLGPCYLPYAPPVETVAPVKGTLSIKLWASDGAGNSREKTVDLSLPAKLQTECAIKATPETSEPICLAVTSAAKTCLKKDAASAPAIVLSGPAPSIHIAPVNKTNGTAMVYSAPLLKMPATTFKVSDPLPAGCVDKSEVHALVLLSTKAGKAVRFFTSGDVEKSCSAVQTSPGSWTVSCETAGPIMALTADTKLKYKIRIHASDGAGNESAQTYEGMTKMNW